MYKEVVVPIYEYLARSRSFTIHKEIHTYKDDIYVGSRRDSMAFTADMIEEAKEYLGDANHPIIACMQTVFTPEVISEFVARKAEIENQQKMEAEAMAAASSAKVNEIQ